MSLASGDIGAMHGAFRRASVRRAVSLVLAASALVALMLLDLTTGPSGMPLQDVWAGLLAGPAGEDKTIATILWQLRMPQTFMGALVGACLGLAGLQMQTILDNPLASPFTLGFSAAAGFGAALAIMFGGVLPLPIYIVTPLAAFAMTLAAAGIVHLIARLRGASPEILVLGGIAVSFFFQSLQSLLQFMASPEVLQQIVFWLFGSLLKASWTSVMVSGLIFLVCLPFVARNCWSLTTLKLGDANARSLGLSVDSIRRQSFVLVALLTAAAVCFVGTIGFVGLIAPHVCRMLVGEDHRFSLPLSAVIGAIILIGASVLGKAISPGAAIPVGIVTAVAGIPMLFAVILFSGNRGRG
jgi:iron complex transport system permease protein